MSEFDDITPEKLINGLQTHGPSGSRPGNTEPVNAELVRERFFKALKEITHLEKSIEEKNTALASAAEEKDRLIHALNKAFEDKKRLQDRIADLDIVRNMEIVEFKTGLDKLRDDNNVLRKQKNELLDDIYKKDKDIEDLKHTIEWKELDITEAKAYLDTALDALRKSELKCKELETNYKEKSELKTGSAQEGPLMLNNMPQHTEIDAKTDVKTDFDAKPDREIEYLNKIAEPDKALPTLKADIDEKITENIPLKKDAAPLQENSYAIAEEAPAPEDLTGKLRLAAGRDLLINEKEKPVQELSADKRLLFATPAETTGTISQFPEKMIYTAPRADMKKKALKTAVAFIIGIAGLLAAYKFLLN